MALESQLRSMSLQNVVISYECTVTSSIRIAISWTTYTAATFWRRNAIEISNYDIQEYVTFQMIFGKYVYVTQYILQHTFPIS